MTAELYQLLLSRTMTTDELRRAIEAAGAEKAVLWNWDSRFMELARHFAGWSKDDGTKVGAVVVGPHREVRATGYNGFPPGVRETSERCKRPRKYLFTEHAERNAIYFAALNGVSLEYCTLYVTMAPCADCARGIIRAGIRRVVCPRPDRDDWAESHAAAMEMMSEAGVEVVTV